MAYDPAYDSALQETLLASKNDYLKTQTLFKQSGHGCGRQALNNLFGEEIFIKTEKDRNHKDQISLDTVCKDVFEELKKQGEKIEEETYCKSNEDYDILVLLKALDYYGYEVDNTSRKPFGFLINTYYIDEYGIKRQHWVVSRKYLEKNVFIDSTLFPDISEFTIEKVPPKKNVQHKIILRESYNYKTMKKVTIPELIYDTFDLTDGTFFYIVNKKKSKFKSKKSKTKK